MHGREIKRLEANFIHSNRSWQILFCKRFGANSLRHQSKGKNSGILFRKLFWPSVRKKNISNFSCMFLKSKFQYVIVSNLNFNCSNLLYARNLQEHVKNGFLLPKLFWPTVRSLGQFLVTECFFNLFPEGCFSGILN